MKLDHAIAKNIKLYPSLFRCYTYELSRQLVLEHFFIVNGNGYEWHDGYLTDNYENPKPYGEEFFGPLFESDYWTKPIITTVKRDDCLVELLKKNNIDVDSTYEVDERADDIERYESIFGPGVKRKLHFYPICKYACICNLPNDIQPDWLAGAREIFDLWRRFFEPDGDWKEYDTYYGSIYGIARLQPEEKVINDRAEYLAKTRDWIRKVEKRILELENK